MNHGHQFDAALSTEHKAEQERKQVEREARKRLEAAAPDLLTACTLAFPLIMGERIKFDTITPTNDTERHLAKLMRECEEKLEQAITKAEPQ